MPDVYRFNGWKEVAELFADLDRTRLGTIGPWLAERATRMLAGWRVQSGAVGMILSNWHPDFIGRPGAALDSEPSKAGALIAVAREHGFESWEACERVGDRPFDLDFENAVDAMLEGRVDEFRGHLAGNPRLVKARSPFGHQATLLHYMAANGVETERQVTPLNARALVEVLLEAGADRDATMPVYGGEHTALELLTTSAHPAAAGVVDEVAALLGR